jgi:hypothetical protein
VFHRTLSLLLLSLLYLAAATPTLAQSPADESVQVDWQELATNHFLLVYAESIESDTENCACGIAEAERYTTFVDDIYLDLVTIFDVSLDTPINLRLFPTEESYYQVNPIAARLTGVIAHALNNRQEIAIASPRTQQMTETELATYIRHELVHFFASKLSDGKLTAGFQEGLAQYLETPPANFADSPGLLEQAQSQGRLLSWAELDEAEKVYSDPHVTYPQSLSVVAFLIDRYGLPAFLNFLHLSATEPGYRSALEGAYGQSAPVLETEWLAYLPDYIESRWQINAIYTYDLSRVTTLVNNGAYTVAEAELQEIITLLQSTHQPETLIQAQTLLAKARQGQNANALTAKTRAALQKHRYEQTIETGQQALTAYQSLGYSDRVPELKIYIHRAKTGQQALAQLQRGQQLLNTLNFRQAETEIYQATITLQALDDPAAAQGLALLTLLAERQSWLAYGLLGIGLILVLANILRRGLNRARLTPLEVEFT